MKNIDFIGLFLLLAVMPAQADPRDDTLSAMLRCSGISDRTQRLACYDGAVGHASTALTAAPPPAVASAVPPPVPPITPHRQRDFMDRLFGSAGPDRAPQNTVAEFGSESIANGGTKAFPAAMDSDTIDQISARLVSYEIQEGHITASLDNGQMWRQVSGDPVPHLARPAMSYVVTIARGKAGVYDMRLSHFGQIVAVRRIR
jgi:hypothetical protein